MINQNLFHKQILVPGQVEDDASVLNGAQHVQTNLDLLRVVRSNNPNDLIIYKPHPDVEAKLRKGRVPLEQACSMLMLSLIMLMSPIFCPKCPKCIR